MTRITPPRRDELPQYAALFGIYEEVMGLVPVTLRSMTLVPGLLEGYVGLAHAAAVNGLISEELAQLAGHLASVGGGCQYCQAHTAAHAEHLGVDRAKLAELWSFESSDRFDDAERAALRLALRTGQHPNEVTDADIDACREHFSDEQISAIVAVCSLFGFLERWNATMATTLEEGPRDTARRLLEPQGWSIGRHAAPEVVS